MDDSTIHFTVFLIPLCAIIYSSRPTVLHAYAFNTDSFRAARISSAVKCPSPQCSSQILLRSNGNQNTAAFRLFPETEHKEEKNRQLLKNELTNGQPLFEEKAEIHPNTVKLLEQQSIRHMTPIQATAFDAIYQGNDVIARSRTGTGKTLAFLLPILEKVGRSNGDGKFGAQKMPKVLIIEPTRELSRQVDEQIRIFGRTHDLSSVCCYGGTHYSPQEEALARGVDVVVGTPGRLIDFLDKQMVDLGGVRHIVLDEADEMLNMGFAADVEKILKYSNVEASQVLLFSATTPRWVHEISKQYLKQPRFLDVVGNDAQRIPPSVKHIAIQAPPSICGRAAIIEDIVSVEGQGGQTIIFTQTKREADELSSEGAFKALNSAVLHGDIGQATREHTMNRFRKGLLKVLVATDVAARGIDVGDVDLVVQCSPPSDPDVYVHRSGRTGRAGRSGSCVLLYAEEERKELSKLEQSCGIRFERKPPPSTVTILTAAATAAARQLDAVANPVIPFFQNGASDLIKRAAAAGMSNEELISRCLAAIARKQEVRCRSTLSGTPDYMTLEFRNLRRAWRDGSDAFYWINRIAGTAALTLPRSIGTIRFGLNDRSEAFFDLPIEVARQFVLVAENDPVHDISVKEAIQLPELQEHNNRYARNSRLIPRKFDRTAGEKRHYKPYGNRSASAQSAYRSYHSQEKGKFVSNRKSTPGHFKSYKVEHEDFKSASRRPLKASYWV